VKAEHFERQVQRVEQERDQWEKKFEVLFPDHGATWVVLNMISTGNAEEIPRIKEGARRHGCVDGRHLIIHHLGYSQQSGSLLHITHLLFFALLSPQSSISYICISAA
jgi:hypothetical protein